MRTRILTCRNLEAEVRLAMERCGCTYPVEVLEENDHDVPHRLRSNIQKKLDAMEHTDRVLLVFTACGGAIAGVRTGDFQLVIPRLDDCLSLLMGSVERRKAVLEGGNGIFVTGAWLKHEKSIGGELSRIRRKYPPDRAGKIIEGLYGHFDSLNVIDTGAEDISPILPETEALAAQLKLRHRVVQGTTALLQQLLQGPHEPALFLTVPPHSQVRAEDMLPERRVFAN